MYTFKVGDCVRFGIAGCGGSVGKIIEKATTYRDDAPRWTVQWIYGRIKDGSPFHAISCHIESISLTPVEKEEYDAVYNSKFNTGFKYQKGK